VPHLSSLASHSRAEEIMLDHSAGFKLKKVKKYITEQNGCDKKENKDVF